MTLIVEDGTGLSTAESYISVANASTYHSNRGNTAWAALATDALREQALRRATGYMEQYYRLRWAGYRVTVTQALSWPRYDVPYPDAGVAWGLVASDLVPVEVSNACAELALRAASADLDPDMTQKVIREKVGPIDTTYANGSSQQTKYQSVENMIKVYFAPGGAWATRA